MRLAWLSMIVALTLEGAAGSPATAGTRSLPFAPAPARLIAECRATATAVGYAVPCPLRLPTGLSAYGGRAGCELQIIGPARQCPGTAPGAYTHASWRGWVVGSGVTVNRQLTLTEHLALVASPRPLTDASKLVNGPAWYPGARVEPFGWATVHGQRMREVYVSPSTNDGSAFAGHVVLIWTAGGHTYGIGFHALNGVKSALALDLELARSIELVPPH